MEEEKERVEEQAVRQQREAVYVYSLFSTGSLRSLDSCFLLRPTAAVSCSGWETVREELAKETALSTATEIPVGLVRC